MLLLPRTGGRRPGSDFQDVPLGLQPGDFATEPLDLKLLRLHLAMTRKRVLGIAGKIAHPFAESICVHIQLTQRLRDKLAPLANQPQARTRG